MLKIGSHVSMKGDLMFLGAVNEALSYQANALMIYTGAPQNTIRKSINELKIKEAHELIKKMNLDFNDIVVHAPYIINLANPDKDKRSFAISFLTEEVKRTDSLGVNKIVLHPGSAVNKNKEEAINWIAEGINKVIKNTENSHVSIALETMAGKGNEVGRTFEELKAIIDLIENKDRVSVCFDTCHTHDSGYDIKNNFDQVLDLFDQVIGIDKISVVHVNDSKNVCGASKDRHENIGFGYIGFDALLKVIYHDKLVNVPKILETPYVDNKAPYFEEIKMIRSKTFDPDLKNKI